MAAPAAGLGLLLFFAAAGGKAPCGILVLAGLPLVIGILSLGLWAERRRRD